MTSWFLPETSGLKAEVIAALRAFEQASELDREWMVKRVEQRAEKAFRVNAALGVNGEKETISMTIAPLF